MLFSELGSRSRIFGTAVTALRARRTIFTAPAPRFAHPHSHPLSSSTSSRRPTTLGSDATSGQKRIESTRAKLMGRPPTLPLFSMQDKVCLVTGAARGLGYEFSRAFVESGCTSLALLDCNEESAREAAVELVESYRDDPEIDHEAINVLGLGCDVMSEESTQEAFDQVVSRFGGVDAVVANAGICEHFAALDYEAERFKRMFGINVEGAFYTAREAAKHMIPSGGGSIVIVSSMSATIVNTPQPQAPYNASKAAARHLSSSLAVEWAKKKVRVNTLSPGYMRTKMTGSVLEEDEGLINAWKHMTPMGRLGDPEELSGAIIYLCSDASKFMTGAEIRVDGGYCCI